MSDRPPPNRAPYLSEQLSKAQRLYLAAVRAGENLEDTAIRLGVRDDTLLRWSRREAFRERLEIIHRAKTVRREQAMAQAAVEAAIMLSDAVAGKVKLDPARQRACVELVKLARRVEGTEAKSESTHEEKVHAGDVASNEIEALRRAIES
ncbi:MAG: hypothetical protein AAF561_06940 [Planctomycetota bacterium]